MNLKFYLVVTRGGSIRTVKSKPSLNYDEISVLMNLELPNAIFSKPQISADIVIPPEAVNPHFIDAEVTDNIKEAIQQASGLEVRLSLINPEIEKQ